MVSMALRVRKLGCLQPIYGFTIVFPIISQLSLRPALLAPQIRTAVPPRCTQTTSQHGAGFSIFDFPKKIWAIFGNFWPISWLLLSKLS